jgi:hypothetical protein
MAGWRQAVALAMTGEEIEALTALSRSRTEPAGRVSRNITGFTVDDSAFGDKCVQSLKEIAQSSGWDGGGG